MKNVKEKNHFDTVMYRLWVVLNLMKIHSGTIMYIIILCEILLPIHHNDYESFTFGCW